MPEHKGQNELPDRFSAGVKARMDDHRLPVDAECWMEIEARMQMPPRRRVVRVWSLAAAAAVLALLMLLPFIGQMGDKVVPADFTAYTDYPEIKVPDGEERLPFGPVALKQHRQLQAVGDPLCMAEDLPVPADDEVAVMAVEACPIPRNLHRQVGPEPEGKVTGRKELPETGTGKKENETNKWLLATAVGTNGHLSLLPGNDLTFDIGQLPTPGDPSLKPGIPPFNPDSKPGPVSPDRYASASYAPTLTFGLTVRKNVGKRLAVETGLVYSYLSTDLYGLEEMSGTASLGLHYLGIPVNLVVYAYKDKRWSLYFSGGCMVEKGMKSILKQDIRQSNSFYSSTTDSSIRGLQWSLNLSAGASYAFYRDWSLYLEPRFSYYFDNYQPRSIRTDKSTVVGVNAGVRFEF